MEGRCEEIVLKKGMYQCLGQGDTYILHWVHFAVFK